MNYNEYKEKLKQEFDKYKEKLKEKLDKFKEKQKKQLEKFKINLKNNKNKSKRKIKGGVLSKNQLIELSFFITNSSDRLSDINNFFNKIFDLERFNNDYNVVVDYLKQNELREIYNDIKYSEIPKIVKSEDTDNMFILIFAIKLLINEPEKDRAELLNKANRLYLALIRLDSSQKATSSKFIPKSEEFESRDYNMEDRLSGNRVNKFIDVKICN